jgi:cyclic pyranopterin phosphate synthase
MIDPFGRAITYLRLSVTDRCDLRCTYCMLERMRFLPRADLLSIDELDRLASAFVGLGVRKLRLTGGEPLVRRGIVDLVGRLARFLASGALDEITLTTNGSRLAEHAEALAANGIRRINVSIDSLQPETYARITRGGRLDQALAGIDAAMAAGIAVKINTVVLRDDNLAELVAIAEWAQARGAETTFIEVMPMGEIGIDRADQHVPMNEFRPLLERRWRLTDLARRTGGPARYVRTDEGGTIGFITPLSRNFCDGCNRVRVTCTGEMYMCLGQSDRADLRAPLRASPSDALLVAAIAEAIGRKPRGHDFAIARGAAPSVGRQMSVTGG